ncbi:FAD-dependent oxidoreductase [Aquimarina aggregata]|uniref:FAD-dependent oxidoreductase n=1 Tax=Aquimarina aggregata TaxID=1642818 RepID=UPI002493C022|nr:FAD-dependent oxidoreductase [Aquimarina aggregata]
MEKIVVIGGGLMGSSVAWKLVDRDAKVVMIEQQGQNYFKGSSIGNTRIARSLGPKKDVFSYAHNKTIQEVTRLLEYLNEEEPKQQHTIDEIYSTSPVSYLYHKNEYAKIEKLRFKKQKKDFNRASPSSSFRKFGMSIPDDTILVREKRQYSGTLNPTELLKKLRSGIEKKGGEIKYEHQVVGLVKKDDIFEVSVLNMKTQKIHKLKAKKVVVCSGAYTVNVLKEFAPYFNKIISPKKVVLSFFKITDDRYGQLSEVEKEALFNSLPFFSQIKQEYFAMISELKEGVSPIIKAGGHQRRRNIHDLEKIWDEKPQKKELKWIKKQFKKHLEMLEIYVSKKDIEEVKSYNCVYSETRTKTPIVTHIFNKYGVLDTNIAVVGGMSGIGAKGCLCYGLLASDLLLGKNDKPDKMYKKMTKAFGNPSVNLYTKRIKPGRLF